MKTIFPSRSACEDLRTFTPEGHDLLLAARLRGRGRTHRFTARLGSGEGPAVWITAKRLAGGAWLIVAANRPGREPCLAYRRRWRIENLFGDAKTRGLDIEDTRLTDPRKLDLLLGLVALAMVWAGRIATDLLGPKAPKRKSHGYYQKSWFRTGFDRIRQLLRTDPLEAVRPWWRLLGSRTNWERVV